MTITHSAEATRQWSVAVSSSPSIHGFGIFATKNIRIGEKIFECFGKKITRPFEVASEVFSVLYPNALGIADGVWLDPDDMCLLRFLNHKCSPSAVVITPTVIIAVHDINTGQEITIDYGTTESDPYWSMECSCKSENCKGVVKASEKPYWRE